VRHPHASRTRGSDAAQSALANITQEKLALCHDLQLRLRLLLRTRRRRRHRTLALLLAVPRWRWSLALILLGCATRLSNAPCFRKPAMRWLRAPTGDHTALVTRMRFPRRAQAVRSVATPATPIRALECVRPPARLERAALFARVPRLSGDSPLWGFTRLVPFHCARRPDA